ncbi:uncharacterized protein LOC126994878 [Eriocheir sinensis]|uniref:uncharacterized protein LOC126994878 n=1 Tax=Eriocheir sinensis TaxID=95602 RepID=UPI0021C90359|nr:uncharacterized protein LOC126994878 [Eriocheir sinensis]
MDWRGARDAPAPSHEALRHRKPLKILQLCDTRWLAIAPCLSRILHQYDELKLHFEISKHEDYAADLLYQMYKDPANKAFLAFLNPIVSQVNRVNKMFEADQCNVSKLLAELISLYQSVLIRLMMPRTFSSQQAVINFDVDDDRNHLPLQAVDMGVQFNIEVGQSNLDPGIVTTIRKHGRDFLMQLLKELQMRLPSNVQLLQSMDALSPETVLGIRKPRLQELSFLPKYNGDISKLDEQWQRLGTVSWPRDSVLDAEKFWMEVYGHTDASGEKDFSEVGKFALSLLAIPVSNASVESIFTNEPG